MKDSRQEPKLDQGPVEIRWKEFDSHMRAAAVTAAGQPAVLIEDHGERVLVEGFRTSAEAEQFVLTGDFTNHDNDWYLFHPAASLRWTRLGDDHS